MARTRLYKHPVNEPVLEMMGDPGASILDVGCGDGTHAAMLRELYPDTRILGLSFSLTEAVIAHAHLDGCILADLESPLPFATQNLAFSTILASHVLEHLREPQEAVSRLAALLEPGGTMVVAIPNLAHWPMRLRLLRGKFEYEHAGILDETHLRFFTFYTADRLLGRQNANLSLTHKTVSGHFPLPFLRRRVLRSRWSQVLDRFVCRAWPNLFGDQILLRFVRNELAP